MMVDEFSIDHFTVPTVPAVIFRTYHQFITWATMHVSEIVQQASRFHIGFILHSRDFHCGVTVRDFEAI